MVIEALSNGGILAIDTVVIVWAVGGIRGREGPDPERRQKVLCGGCQCKLCMLPVEEIWTLKKSQQGGTLSPSTYD